MRSRTTWNMFMCVPLGNTTLTYKFLRIFTSHSMLLWKEATWIPLAESMARDGSVWCQQ